jgi:hypothetical protein
MPCSFGPQAGHAIAKTTPAWSATRPPLQVIRVTPCARQLCTTAAVVQVIVSRHVRDDVLRLISRVFAEVGDLAPRDTVLQAHVHLLLDDPDAVAQLLSKLVEDGDEQQLLLALQIAFDLFDNDVYVRGFERLLASALACALCSRAVFVSKCASHAFSQRASLRLASACVGGCHLLARCQHRSLRRVVWTCL